LRDEFNQAWEHYRHIESVRTQYLALFFAVLTGAVGVGSQAAARSNFADTATVLAFSASLFVLTVFAAFVYVTVRKADVVMAHYETVINRVRDYFYKWVDPDAEPFKSLNIRVRNHPMLGGKGLWRLARIQTSVETVVLGTAVLTSCGQAVLLVMTLVAASPNWTAVAIETGLVATSCLALIGLVLLRMKGNQLISPDLP